MKKKLEAELISIAHRILKLKNKSDVEQLYVESRLLYEKLAILRFAEQQFGDAKPTIGLDAIRDRIDSFCEVDHATEATDERHQSIIEKPAEGINEVVADVAAEDQESIAATADIADETNPESFETQEQHEVDNPEDDNNEAVSTPVAEEADNTAAEIATDEESEIQPEAEADSGVADEPDSEHAGELADDVPQAGAESVSDKDTQKQDNSQADDFMIPTFELTFEKKEELKSEDEPERRQITFEDLLGPNYSDPIFEKVSDKASDVEFDGAADGELDNFKPEAEVVIDQPASADLSDNPYKTAAAKDISGRMITFGLNDRIGFEKNLFGGSSEDMNRVVSQLTTFDTFEQAREFIEDMVKPDYNNWEGKDDYAGRFMDIVERKFS